MRIGLLTDGVHPYATGESGFRCGRPVRGLPQREFGPVLLAKRFFGVALPVTGYGIPTRAHFPAASDAPYAAPARAPLAGFDGRLAIEAGRQALIAAPGNLRVRRRRHCGAAPAERRFHPGPAAERFGPFGDPGRPGAAARARALELLTVEQNLTAFHGICLELSPDAPTRREAGTADAHSDPPPFAAPPEARLLGRWPRPGPHLRPSPRSGPPATGPARAVEPGNRPPERPGAAEPRYTTRSEGVSAVVTGPAGDSDA
ncbi:hypothetical protein [Streptomyces sp. NPDC091649]|uniref:hypothetical protein n=1 Tax=Streptomyces sp. NPDC091649 TaxID=3366004 RepID=UPI00380D5CA5